MTTPELIQFVKNEIALGISKESITIKLKSQGWSDLDVAEVFTVMGLNDVKPILSPQGYEIIPPVKDSMTADVSALTSVQIPLNRKPLLYVISSLILIFIFGGVALAFTSGYFISDTKLLSQMIDASKKNTSVTLDFNLDADISEMKIPDSSFGLSKDSFKKSNFNMKGSFDFLDPKNIKFNSLYSFKTGDIEAIADVRAIDGSLYVSLTKAPNLGFFSLKPFEGKWIVIPYKDKSGNLASNPLLSMTPIDSSSLNNLTEEQKLKINDIFSKASLIVITKKHLPEMVNGSLSYHLDFDIDKEGITKLFKDLTDYVKSIDKNSSLTNVDASNYDKTFLKAIKSFKGELWVGVFDKIPRKIVINLDITNPDKPEDGVVKISTQMSYSDWNKPVTVNVPSQSVTFQELMSQAFGGLMDVKSTTASNINIETPSMNSTNPLENAKYKNIEKIIKDTFTNMSSQAELFSNFNKYGYKGFCSSKGENGAYKIAIGLPKGTIYKCNDSEKEWVATAKLISNNYWCVDSSGSSLARVNLPSKMSCQN